MQMHGKRDALIRMNTSLSAPKTGLDLPIPRYSAQRRNNFISPVAVRNAPTRNQADAGLTLQPETKGPINPERAKLLMSPPFG
jgi:hypothetical protein